MSVKINRRTIFDAGAGAIIATLFPEIARADSTTSPLSVAGREAWQWQPDAARQMTTEERAEYSRYFESDLQEAEARFGRRADGVTNMSITDGPNAVIALSDPRA
ncbi:hypothetical protein [Rathayibacter sp. VKM Ac-2805]|uniref:hypothetical protein n=1 Tax=Rathayibacter sp. VKM Ac-2805 TaxID=2609258 RepID=UPI00132029CB|nr:hypothetical protein [Rathayibacter sp. VKM Ac-2805]QHC74977.1 hypothetical protein GSU40_15550 [Rathayibacter sp. VKM Ac-2805]